jgi:hypothetical protein
MVLTVISALIVVFTGGLARQAGTALGVGDAALTVWSIAKWPVLVVLVTVMIAIPYWASPNAKVKGFRWITPGSFTALVIWLAASAGFAFYVADFASYNRTYGTMAGVIVFLVWLWITNLTLLLGLEIDAETVRRRAVAGGLPPTVEPYTQPRSTHTWDEADVRRLSEELRVHGRHRGNRRGRTCCPEPSPPPWRTPLRTSPSENRSSHSGAGPVGRRGGVVLDHSPVLADGRRREPSRVQVAGGAHAQVGAGPSASRPCRALR